MRRMIYFLALTIVLASFGSAQFGSSGASFSGPSSFYGGATNSWQYYRPSFTTLYRGQVGTYWPFITKSWKEQCKADSDFIVMIPPGGCQPAVVRSDLLEEQNVPVFCQLYAIKVNPLIKVSTIRSITFSGKYPKDVAGVSFHPARAAVRSYSTLLGDPLVNNIGYVVLILRRNPKEREMPKWVSGNLTATIYYDADEAFGVGRNAFYLKTMSDQQWESEYKKYSFWRGHGFLRLLDISGDSAKIQILDSKNHPIRTLTLKKGQTSNTIYIPGFYCMAGIKARLDEVTGPDEEVLLNIDGNSFWARAGTEFLNGRCKVRGLVARNDGSGFVDISCYGTGTKRLRIGTINLTALENKTDKKEGSSKSSEDYDEPFSESEKSVLELVNEFGAEKKRGLDTTYAEEELLNEINLALELKKTDSAKRLIKKFLERYPDSPYYYGVFDLSNRLGKFNYSMAYGYFLINGRYHTIVAEKFHQYDSSKKGVNLRIDGRSYRKKEGEVIEQSDGKIKISKITPGYVVVSKTSNGPVKTTTTKTIKEGEEVDLGGSMIYVSSIDVEKIARVSLIPRVSHTKTSAQFSFKIGIEKRAIHLSPERAERMARKLNKTIEKWESINNKLGKVIKAWKGACFATSSLLMVKTMLNGFSGETLARRLVMKKYKAWCDKEHPEMTHTQCYNKYSKQINGAVKELSSAMRKVNERIDESVKKNTEGKGLFGLGGVLNEKKHLEELKKEVAGETFKINVDGKDVTIKGEELNSISQIRSALLMKELRNAGDETAKEIAEESLNNNLKYLAMEKAYENQKKEIAGGLGLKVNPNIHILSTESTRILQKSGGKASYYFGSLPDGVKGDEDVEFVYKDGKSYMLVLGALGSGGYYGVKEVFEKKGGKWEKVKDKKEFNDIYFSSGGSCSYEWPKGRAKVRYYETGKNEKLPAIVPFDLKHGWYAFVPDTRGSVVDNSPKGYYSSGDVNFFWICNIGPNRLMEYKSGDDICQSFDVSTAGSVDSFMGCPELSGRDVKMLYRRAVEAIRQASQQYGKKRINVLGQMLEGGAPMSSQLGFECQDFMSPEDCNLMFNMCDPVICPPSRCNLGGRYHVTDVIRSGIIGSIALCLPNWNEGIKVPVCLSGIHAGIEGFLSVLKGEQNCLEQNAKNGEHIGICDESTSIYMCEFFWKQFAPMMDYLVPSLVDTLQGSHQGARGGGEYLMIKHSWENLGKSVNYFQNEYAKEIFRAFRLRSVQEAGTPFCRAFIGTSLPASGEAIDKLLEPESPAQFYAKFTETPFTDVTTPPTSQYSVYYHIYAGKDKGVNYRIYLKNPPSSGYYQQLSYITIDTGYLPRGQSLDQKRDFTAPSGYQKLCVMIDAREECGFKQVSSNFAVNYLQKKFVEDQVKQTHITTSKECISGSPSVSAMVSPLSINLQGGVENVMAPHIEQRGIVRICANENPSSSTGNRSRWVVVGYCDNPNIKCWLDTESVKRDIKEVLSIENRSLKDLEKGLSWVVDNQEITEKEVLNILADARKRIKELNRNSSEQWKKNGVQEILEELDKIIGNKNSAGAGTNTDKAEALALKSSLYRRVVEVLFEDATKMSGGKSGKGKGKVTLRDIKKIADGNHLKLYSYKQIFSLDEKKGVVYEFKDFNESEQTIMLKPLTTKGEEKFEKYKVYFEGGEIKFKRV